MKIPKTRPVMAAASYSILLTVAALFSDGHADEVNDGKADRSSIKVKRFQLDRYAKLLSNDPRSPFEWLPEAPTPSPAGPPPFKDYSLHSYAKHGSSVRVTLIHKKTKAREYLTSEKSSPGGFTLVDLKKSKNYRHALAIVSKNGETGSVGFETHVANVRAQPSQRKQQMPNPKRLVILPSGKGK